LILASFAASGGASERVRAENGRSWIECRDASLPDMLREMAVVVPMEGNDFLLNLVGSPHKLSSIHRVANLRDGGTGRRKSADRLR
jgi:hypothetical protein